MIGNFFIGDLVRFKRKCDVKIKAQWDIHYYKLESFGSQSASISRTTPHGSRITKYVDINDLEIVMSFRLAKKREKLMSLINRITPSERLRMLDEGTFYW